jgi:hypothetical protein
VPGLSWSFSRETGLRGVSDIKANVVPPEKTVSFITNYAQFLNISLTAMNIDTKVHFAKSWAPGSSGFSRYVHDNTVTLFAVGTGGFGLFIAQLS